MPRLDLWGEDQGRHSSKQKHYRIHQEGRNPKTRRMYWKRESLSRHHLNPQGRGLISSLHVQPLEHNYMNEQTKKAAALLGRLGGKSGKGKRKARSREQCQRAANIRWSAFRMRKKEHRSSKVSSKANKEGGS